MGRHKSAAPSLWEASSPQPTFASCAGCDALVLVQVAGWTEVEREDGKTIRVPTYGRQEAPLNPVTGSVHRCAEALAWTVRVHGLRWSAVQAAQAYEAYRDALRESAAAKEHSRGAY